MKNNKLKNKEVGLEKMITPDMAKAMDILAYDFLKKEGYDTEHCEEKTQEGKNARARLNRQLQKNGVELEWHLPTHENKIFCYFNLVKIGNPEEKVANSTIGEIIRRTNLNRGK